MVRDTGKEIIVLLCGGDKASQGKDIEKAKELNLNRKGLYKAFSEKGNPSFFTVVKVLDNLCFRLSVEQKASA
jgi:DNA-binding phage protein